MISFRETANFIWGVADLLRGDYKQSDYGKVILPLTVLRRLDCLLAPTRTKVLEALPKFQDKGEMILDAALNKITGYKFHNRSKFDFANLVADPAYLAANLRKYISGFSESVRDIVEQFGFEEQIDRLDKADLLYQVVKRFGEIDLTATDPMEMGYIFEELIRKFAEQSNETAGDHFTPREVIRLMVNLLFLYDHETLTKKGVIRTLYDPTAGTGGMLSVGEIHLNELNPQAKLLVFGQEINSESYAICKADMLIKGQDPHNIRPGNTLSQDGFEDQKFDYMLSNPPFGVDWKKVEKKVKAEASFRNFENIPLLKDVEAYLKHEVLSHVPDAWIDHHKTKVGNEVNFTKYFHRYKPLQSLTEMGEDAHTLERETDKLLKEVLS